MSDGKWLGKRDIRSLILNKFNDGVMSLSVEFSQNGASATFLNNCIVPLEVNTIKVKCHAAEYEWYETLLASIENFIAS